MRFSWNPAGFQPRRILRICHRGECFRLGRMLSSSLQSFRPSCRNYWNQSFQKRPDIEHGIRNVDFWLFISVLSVGLMFLYVDGLQASTSIVSTRTVCVSQSHLIYITFALMYISSLHNRKSFFPDDLDLTHVMCTHLIGKSRRTSEILHSWCSVAMDLCGICWQRERVWRTGFVRTCCEQPLLSRMCHEKK